jgi:hypothetical protein
MGGRRYALDTLTTPAHPGRPLRSSQFVALDGLKGGHGEKL